MNSSYNKTYIFAITLVATLGGLLFGYDTAVISGAEKSIQAFLIEPLGLSTWIHGATVSSALIGCILGGAISGFFSNRIGRREPSSCSCTLLSFGTGLCISRSTLLSGG